jgi:hypothetical protein
VKWANDAEKSGLPSPLISGLVNYQFVTIHLYFDGNGRIARLLATFLLQKSGYGLGGFFSQWSITPATVQVAGKISAIHRQLIGKEWG